MVAKQAVRKQQNTSRAGVRKGFAVALEQCALDADAEAVHRLRTGSRRLQAMIESALPELGKPAQVWLRELKKIRRAAGAVRDLDVQRKLLEGWATNDSLRLQVRELDTWLLDTWLKDQRKHKAQDMQKQISKRRKRFAEQEDALFAALNATPAGHADSAAMELFVRAADAMPRLDAENLHDFRKAAKKARYVAEAGPSAATDLAKTLKRIQDAIGDWHDWLCLQQAASKALRHDAPELTAALQREVERHFSVALMVTETMRGRLLGEWLARKRPAASTIPGKKIVIPRGARSA